VLVPYLAFNKTADASGKSFVIDSFELSLPYLGIA
jgi:hypothetical protein